MKNSTKIVVAIVGIAATAHAIDCVLVYRKNKKQVEILERARDRMKARVQNGEYTSLDPEQLDKLDRDIQFEVIAAHYE